MNYTQEQSPIQRLLTLVPLFKSLRLGQIVLDGVEYTIPQYGLLQIMNQNPGWGVGDIAAMLEVSTPTISIMVQKLIQKKLIEQRTNLNDKRAKPLFLTQEGQRILQEMRIYHERKLEKYFSVLSPQEIEILVEMFERVVYSAAENKVS